MAGWVAFMGAAPAAFIDHAAVRQGSKIQERNPEQNPARNPPPVHGVIRLYQEDAAMPEIRESNGICTQITTVKLSPDNQDEIVRLMVERARFMATQPGFV